MKRGKKLFLILSLFTLFILVALTSPLVFAYSTVIDNGFEEGNLNSWFNDGGGAIISTDAHSGNYAANEIY